MKIFDVISTSFDRFDNTVTAYLNRALDGIGQNSQMFNVIFTAIKGIMQNAMFYIEDALTEQNIYTASRKKSIYSLAKSSGYEAYYGSSAVGMIRGNVSINNGLVSSISTKISILDHTSIVDRTTGIQYFIMLNMNKYVIDINAPLKTHEFKIVQGTHTFARYIARGESLEKISVNITGLFDRDFIEVRVDGKKWTQVSCLYDMSYNSEEYILTVGYENTFDIMFGNGVHGRIPESGSSIEVVFVSHAGSAGNISNPSEARFMFNSPGYDSYGNVVDLNEYVKLNLTNVVSGGTDADSIEFVRNMIGYNSRSNVLASEENYKLFFKRFSFVGQVNCWSEKNSMTIWATCTSNVIENLKEVTDYYALHDKDFMLSETQKSMILNTLENSKRTFAGINLKFQDPVIRRFAILCYVKIKSEYAKQSVENDIREVFGRYFMSLDNDIQFIPKNDLVNLGSTCNENIESFDIDIVSEMNETAFYNKYYYKYEMTFNNGVYSFEKKKTFYEGNTTLGLDLAGNIQLDTKLEIPVLGGFFRYFPDKESNNTTEEHRIEPITFFYI